jgi:RNA polymerase sigma-70 factor (ECF subfamily)
MAQHDDVVVDPNAARQRGRLDLHAPVVEDPAGLVAHGLAAQQPGRLAARQAQVPREQDVEPGHGRLRRSDGARGRDAAGAGALPLPTTVSRRPPSLPDERAVVERAKRGDRRAFESIYRAYAAALFGYVLVPMLGDRDDAQDCLRETFLAAHAALASYEWRESGIYGWLKVLAKNKARDLLRASGRRQRLRGAFAEHVDAMTGPADDPTEEEIQREALRAQIHAVLRTMNPRYAQVLELRLLAGRSREDCAAALDVKIGTLDVLLFRAVRAFRAACEKQGVTLRGEL